MTDPLISAHPIWRNLQQQAMQMPSLRELFAQDTQRFEKFSQQACGIFLDYSKQRVDQKAWAELFQLARVCQVEAQRDAMFLGERINTTEQRPALHVALRALPQTQILLNETNVVDEVQAVQQRMIKFCNQVHNGSWRGFKGKPIKHIVNIGIGGSDLGPLMACHALKPYARADIKMHFVSNVDGCQLVDVLAQIEADTTLFIIASKTFTTLETMLNAHSARTWMMQQGCPEKELKQHFVAASSNLTAAQEFGIQAENIFPFWDWVGGRYSLWGAVGLAILLAIGAEHFIAMLRGAQALDQHFLTAPLEKNLPVLFALVGIWNINFRGYHALSIAPYHQHLAYFPAYLQQLEMESTGKTVTRDGQRIDYATCPILFGEPGTNSQHAYFQMLHQGSQIIPVDFIAVVKDQSGLIQHTTALLANCLAQSQALAFGKNTSEVSQEMPIEKQALAIHRTFMGDRPSNTILLSELTPYHLGALVALYEHKVFVQAMIWKINPFDQWGVELGKIIATRIMGYLNKPESLSNKQEDASTTGLLQQIQLWRTQK